MNKRESILQEISSSAEFDLVVIGGGATGLGSALDACLRGMKVLVLEQEDFGSGASSKSTKLIHGGVRYLEQGHIGLVLESLRERGRLLKNAKNIVEKQAFVIPLYSHWEKVYFGIGLKMYDWLSGSMSIGSSKVLSRKSVIEKIPNVKTDKLKGGVLYWDGKFDDTALLIALAKSIIKEGGLVLNYAYFDELILDENGKIKGVRWENKETAQKIETRTKSVLNATGAFVEQVLEKSGDESPIKVKPSRGTHITIDARLFKETAMLIPKTSDGRLVFCIPWMGKVMVGTTDIEEQAPELNPKHSESEIEFIIETYNRYAQIPLSRNDVKAVFTGQRPLVVNTAKRKNTKKISRKHAIHISKSGMVSIGGGKWTTYRKMAEDAIDKVISLQSKQWKQCSTTSYKIDLLITMPDKEIDEHFVKYCCEETFARTSEDILARRSRIVFLDQSKAESLRTQIDAWMNNYL